ncbi:MAG TPA: hypothetical protein DD732_07460 [Rhizobiales bacterium]|jgi:hypothetical protein|nr:hypothetical protein [Hyphomicrobiales bacterium]
MTVQAERALQAEEWRPIPGAAGYEASDLGNVRSLDRLIVYVNGCKRFYQGKKLAPQINPNGYHNVTIGRTTYNIGALVCLAFHGEKPTPKHEVAHWDNDRTNNVPSNVRWATRKENHADKIRHGTCQRGSNSGHAKLTEDAVVHIRRLASLGVNKNSIALRYGVSVSLIFQISARSIWRHI